MIKPRKIKSDHIPLALMIAGFLLIQIFNPFDINVMISAGTWIIVLSCVVVFSRQIAPKRRITIDVLVLYTLILINLFSMIIRRRFSYASIVSMGCFLEIPIIVCAYTEEQEDVVKRIIYYVFSGIGVFYFLLSVSPFAYLFTTQWGTAPIPQLTLSYNNPNEAAMYLFTSIIVMTSFYSKMDKKRGRLILITGIACMCTLMILTESRTGILATGVYFLLLRTYKKKTISRGMIALVLWIPILYVVLARTVGDFMLWGDTVSTGRMEIYNRVLENLDFTSFLFGNFNFSFQNLHNAIISIFGTVGVLGTAAFYYIINNKIFYLGDCVRQSGENKQAFLGLICMIMYTATEAAFFTAGSAFAVCFLAVYFLCLPEKKE